MEPDHVPTHYKRTIVLRGDACLPETELSVAIADAELIALLGETAARHLGKGSRSPGRADRLLVTPLPDLHGSVLTSSKIQRHQRMGAHALHIVHLVAQHLFWV